MDKLKTEIHENYPENITIIHLRDDSVLTVDSESLCHHLNKDSFTQWVTEGLLEDIPQMELFLDPPITNHEPMALIIDSGGGEFLDVLVFDGDKFTVSISDDCVVVYKNFSEFKHVLEWGVESSDDLVYGYMAL